MCFRHQRQQTTASKDKVQWYAHFVQELLHHLEYGVSAMEGYRYGRIKVGWGALSQLVREVVQEPAEAWPSALARLLCTLFYDDPAVIGCLAQCEGDYQHEKRRLEAEMADCQKAQEQAQYQQQVTRAELQIVRGQMARLKREFDSAQDEIARLEGLLYSREAHIRTQNDVIGKLREELRQLRGQS